jgi:8-oxo-dGTP pyrophosphatase MutT (NUDIX family)
MEWPVSVKAVLGWEDRYVLLRNDRGEWELPGGRLDRGEQPTEALERELMEELSVKATVGRLVLAEAFEVVPRRWVLLIVYRCTAARPRALSYSEEPQAVTTASLDELEHLSIPGVYVRAIHEAHQAA